VTLDDLLVTLAGRVLALPEDRPATVAVDGMSGVGKTTLAGLVAGVVGGAGRAVVPVSYDDFHRPAARRHRQGRLSASGYLEDSYDAEALDRLVLSPLVAGEGSVVVSAYDLADDVPLDPVPVDVPAGAVAIVEGEFLLGLDHAWDLGVLLVADPAVVLERALERDQDLGEPDRLREAYLRRYFPAWSLYEERFTPWQRADLVIDTTDLGAPRILTPNFP
jgi:uridine kinase